MKVYASSLIVRRPARPARHGLGHRPTVHGLHRRHGHPAWPVGIQDFDPDALADPRRLELAARIEVLDDGNPDPNAMCPQRVELHLRDGRCGAGHARVSGQPGAAAGRSRARRQVPRLLRLGQPPVPPDRAEALIRRLRRLEDAAELREIVALLSAADCAVP